MDLTVGAIPGYFASMAAERRWLAKRARVNGPSAADYERRDTAASLTMGTLSLVLPLVGNKVLAKVLRRDGHLRRGLLVGVAGAAAVTTVADRLARLDRDGPPPAAGDDDRESTPLPPHGGHRPLVTPAAGSRATRRRIARAARGAAAIGGVATVVVGGAAVTTTWARWTVNRRFWDRRLVRDLGTGPLILAAAVFGWDFIYYWNHRLMHESRFMWAHHVVHHSSERYNLSTALRQPVSEFFATFLPTGLLSLFGIRPALIDTARGINLLYQYWIHTEVIGRLGPFERVLNTPSHHRVHHGSNPQYIDRNHGSILIVWDRLFGTFEPEEERVVYGLTKNVGTFDPLKIASHEYLDILKDVAGSTSWRERLSFVVRGPGWAYERHRERAAALGALPEGSASRVALHERDGVERADPEGDIERPLGVVLGREGAGVA